LCHEHIAALLLVIGCSNTMTECRIACASQRFRDRGRMHRRTAFRPGDGGRPHIVGECLAVDPALEDDYNQIAWQVQLTARLMQL
jgi:hypothetical protein